MTIPAATDATDALASIVEVVAERVRAYQAQAVLLADVLEFDCGGHVLECSKKSRPPIWSGVTGMGICGRVKKFIVSVLSNS